MEQQSDLSEHVFPVFFYYYYYYKASVQGRIQGFWNGVHMYKGVGGFALLILSNFLKYPMKMK